MSCLPIEPLRKWIESQPGEQKEIAERLGVDQRVLYRWRHESKKVQLDAVDEALTRAGVHLWELWPDVYEEHEQALKPLAILAQEDTVRRAKTLYDLGASMMEISRELWPGSGYSSSHALKLALSREFRNQGWQRRSRSEAMKLRMSEGWIPPVRCRAQTVKGERCRRAPMRDSVFCHGHDPSTKDVAVRTMLAVRERFIQNCVPVEPLARWLDARGRQVGRRVVAERSGLHREALNRYCRRGHAWVRADTVRRLVAAYGDGTTFEDLYQEQEAA